VNRLAPTPDQEAEGSKPIEARHRMEPLHDDPTLSEIHRLEQDLENLAARYSALLQSALWLKRGFIFFAAVLICLMAVGVILGNLAFVVTMALPLLLIAAIGLIGPRGLQPWLPGSGAGSMRSAGSRSDTMGPPSSAARRWRSRA
jgi:hypothetical protein